MRRPEETPPEARYRCPRCKLTVVVLLTDAKVSCTRCGRPMKEVSGKEAEAKP